MTPWSQLAPKVHLRREVKYWKLFKCHSPSALHFPEMQGSRSETFRLHRFSFASDSLSPNSLPGVAMLHQYTQKVSTGCRLQAAGYRPEAAGCKLQATGCRRGVTASQGLQAAGNKLQVKLQTTSIMFWGGPQDHFGMLAGFQKAVISICICCLGVGRWKYFWNMSDG